ncbi:MAG: hypothetical protein WD768_04300 [Phycisphaeraceae bacterium]
MLSTPPFPLRRSMLIVTIIIAAMLALELWLVPKLFGYPTGGTQAVLLMVALVWVTGMISLLPVARSGAKGPLGVVKAFFIGMGVRVLAAVLMLAFAIKSLHLPPGPVAVSLMMTYLPVLFVETRLIVGYVKQVPVPPFGGTKAKADEEGSTDAAKPQAAQDNPNARCSEALA